MYTLYIIGIIFHHYLHGDFTSMFPPFIQVAQAQKACAASWLSGTRLPRLPRFMARVGPWPGVKVKNERFLWL